VLEAVLFDWSDTLVHFEWDDALVEAGHRAALGRDDAEFSAHWRELLLGDQHGRRPYAELLTELGVKDPEAFIDAEHEVWLPAYGVLASAPALLESLRDRGLRTGIVASTWPEPTRVLEADAAALGLSQHADTFVFKGGDYLLRSCSNLEVEPSATLFVGDSLPEVQEARNLGMRTVQALWFRADDTLEIEPDFQAFTAMDVLNIASRLARSPQ
jgi:HAD superfamily hydrolase (TIGR01509 family)